MKLKNGTKFKLNVELSKLKEIEKEISMLKSASALLYWDRATILPAKAVPERSEQAAYLSKLIHEKLISKELKRIINILSEPNNIKKLDKISQLIVKKYQKDLKKLTKIPTSHVEEFSRLCIKSLESWEKARNKNDFKIFQPYLQKVLEMKLQEVSYIDSKSHPYNVLLDDYEEGMTVESVKKVFEKLKYGLLEIISKVKTTDKYLKSKRQINKLSQLDFPLEQQREIIEEIRKMILVDMDRTIIAESVHPFTNTISSDDVRITTAYRKGQPLFAFTSTAHECGHALYELDFDPKVRDTILFNAPSYGLHESQSRIWENQIMRSEDFWKYYFPRFKKKFPSLKNIKREEFYELMNQVKESLVRIECDEVTYCLHIIIRFEIEVALLEGKIKVKDLPQEWNKKYQEYLHIKPRNDKVGVLQDMHWSEGLFGYFPTYAIGTMYSAMLFKQMCKDNPKLMQEIKKGKVDFVRSWLKEHVHKHAGKYLAKDVVKKATGKYLSPDDFLEYLNEKYGKIYGF
ncbi:carboxypeptidase M32 [archaeon]|jgi:carboxypeptidase Taq|nr:carboxypeptidase M32 [archaeon]MBT3450368.1 carboxypeptidase M32 [archaeon]MBT6868857.1 carboxypeptidase M32 [archaeon]MBT7192922.1 carboxypeptidase M32 [archaeon]MBT7380888.1 carboxypeptidase M32 [archaeon]